MTPEDRACLPPPGCESAPVTSREHARDIHESHDLAHHKDIKPELFGTGLKRQALSRTRRDPDIVLCCGFSSK